MINNTVDQETIGKIQQNIVEAKRFYKLPRRSTSNPKSGSTNRSKRYQSANPSKKYRGQPVEDINPSDLVKKEYNDPPSKNVSMEKLTAFKKRQNSSVGTSQAKIAYTNEKLSQAHTKSQTLSIYNITNHKKMSGYYYDQDSSKTPPFYNRTGPGLYFQNTEPMKPLDTRINVESKHHKPPGQIIGNEDFPKGFYSKHLPHHRFVDYSKSQLNCKIRQSKQIADYTMKLHQYREHLPAAQLISDKKFDILNPNRELVEKNQKNGQTIPKKARPELFPVKDEHRNPCSYLRKNHSELNKRNVSSFPFSNFIHFHLQVAINHRITREFQEDPEYKSPGPVHYMPEFDPGRTPANADKPLTNKKSFIDHSKKTIPNAPRESAFGNRFKNYIGPGHDKLHHNTGTRLGPGPGGINLREYNEGIKTFHDKKTSTTKSTMNQEQRYIGQPH